MLLVEMRQGFHEIVHALLRVGDLEGGEEQYLLVGGNAELRLEFLSVFHRGVEVRVDGVRNGGDFGVFQQRRLGGEVCEPFAASDEMEV